jgi:hypothetical protein
VIYTHVATAILSASLSFYGGWTVNQWRHDASQKQAIEAAAVAQRELHALEQKRSNGVIAAQNVARTRETALRRDADSARDALDGLRTQSEAALQSARSSHDACLIAANAQAVVQSQCATELQTLARDADGHASDAVMLRDAWPR